MAYTKPVVADYSPGVGGTVTIPPFDDAVLAVFVNPATPIVGTVNIVLPGNSMHGQVIRVFFTNAISILNITAPATGGIIGSLTSAVLGASAVFAYNVNLDKWIKG